MGGASASRQTECLSAVSLFFSLFIAFLPRRLAPSESHQVNLHLAQPSGAPRLQTSLLVSVSLLMVLRFAVKRVGGGWRKKLSFLRQKEK